MRLSVFMNRMSGHNISSLRMKYNEKSSLFIESSIVPKNPIIEFEKWFCEASESPEIIEPNGMCLSTATRNGIPSSRWVLLKAFTDKGFTFFTNYGSRKAQEIADNPNVALAFYWPPLKRSIRIEGTVEKISKSESETYFHERPRSSQICALASPQSQRVTREYLDNAEEEIKQKLGTDKPVPLPNWGGYLVVPHTMEFWQGQTNRLHDRIRFRRGEQALADIDNQLVHLGENGWVYERLAP